MVAKPGVGTSLKVSSRNSLVAHKGNLKNYGTPEERKGKDLNYKDRSEIEDLRESAKIARLALRNEESDHLKKYKEQFYERLKKSEMEDAKKPLTSCVKKVDKVSTKHDEKLYEKISKEKVKELLDFAESSNYVSVGKYRSNVFTDDDSAELPYGCTAKEVCDKDTELDLDIHLANLKGLVDVKNMFIIWNKAHNIERKKYIDMYDSLYNLCEQLQQKYRVPNEIKQKEWNIISAYLMNELLEKDHKDSIDFQELVKKGPCNRINFKEYIESKRNSRTFLTSMMMDSWKDILIEKIKSHGTKKV
ncbi:Phist protein (Pf-fam-b) [Plasmodium ovale wallikeri]|uniref:Phist protein (Pf-fam-b) n=1 Tax=Plasmodium ovale wallikeri TaxID=864142 RepID=A0A1A8YM36_PLAOA|nr:Phist protein (Pf-fam-b) [Plasmodium ovale wallikeri]SBT32439.1 Phist protein (Pf-fam-b) [Plasmodium ovale wallikeri]